MECGPLFLKTFHSFKHCSTSWWTGPRFKLRLPESNDNDWESDSIKRFEIEMDWCLKIPIAQMRFMYMLKISEE